jgi:hypothetical protein
VAAQIGADALLNCAQHVCRRQRRSTAWWSCHRRRSRSCVCLKCAASGRWWTQWRR